MTKKRKKTALVLSGGGSRGAYEAGAWQALVETGIEIDIVTGASVGSINGAMVCQGDLESTVSLWKEIETHNVFDVPEKSQPMDYAKEIIFNKGVGTSGLKKLLSDYIDEEQIRKSPIDYGLVVVERASLKPHFLYKEDIPEGQLIDYIMASSSVFPAIHAYEIDGKEYIDGGYADVLPINMALKKGAERVIAVKLNALGIINNESLKKAPELTVVESKWNLGNTLIFDIKNSRRIMRLGYLDAMKAIGVFDGSYYTFAKGSFNKTDCKMADACGYIFQIAPTLIYTEKTFAELLSPAVNNARKNLEEAVESFKTNKMKLLGAADMIKNLKEVSNSQIICFIIAENLKEKGADSIFLKRSMVRLFPQQLLAARFLVKYDMV